MKQPALVAAMVENSSIRGDIVYDPFLGSGTTMVAAEQLGRLAYGMEISPAYVAVSLQRLADMGLEL
jgi:DNA modification methylase